MGPELCVILTILFAPPTQWKLCIYCIYARDTNHSSMPWIGDLLSSGAIERTNKEVNIPISGQVVKWMHEYVHTSTPFTWDKNGEHFVDFLFKMLSDNVNVLF